MLSFGMKNGAEPQLWPFTGAICRDRRSKPFLNKSVSPRTSFENSCRKFLRNLGWVTASLSEKTPLS